MYKYEMIIFWSNDDSCYIADVPELPGCMADGKTAIEALENAELAIAEWIDTALAIGRDVPQPQGRLFYA